MDLASALADACTLCVGQTHEVEKSYGSVLVSINFCSWIYPLATPSVPAE